MSASSPRHLQTHPGSQRYTTLDMFYTPLPDCGMICCCPEFFVSALKSLNCLQFKRTRKGLAILTQSWQQAASAVSINPDLQDASAPWYPLTY